MAETQQDKWTYDIELSGGRKAVQVRRSSLSKQDLILGFIDNHGYCTSNGNMAGARLCETDILMTALECSTPEELQEKFLGDDPDEWPIIKQELLMGVVNKERPALWRSRGLNADGTVTEERKRLVYLERLAGLVQATVLTPAESEGAITAHEFTVDAETAVALGIKAQEPVKDGEGEHGGPPADTSSSPTS